MKTTPTQFWSTKPIGGYRLIRPWELLATWHLYKGGALKPLDLRVWYACQELESRRCTMRHPKRAQYSLEELASLLRKGVVDTSTSMLRAALGRLRRCGALTWSAEKLTFANSLDELQGEGLDAFWASYESVANRRRRVPVPRRTIQLIAGGASRATIATMLGHLLTCVYHRDRGCRSDGRCKASWIASTFSVSVRSVRSARAHLLEIGWLLERPAAQWQLNRWGKAVAVNLSWSRPVGEGRSAPSETAPPPAEIAPAFAPPESDKELPTGSKNQKPAFARTSGSHSRKHLGAPRISNVVKEDLDEMSRLMTLFPQASERGFLGTSEADRLHFVAAAEHARTVGSTNPPGLFVWIVRGARWGFLTQGDEDAAGQRIKRHFHGEVRAAHDREGLRFTKSESVVSLSQDAKIVQAMVQFCEGRGVRQSPLSVLRATRPEWTSERWDRASRELGDWQLESMRL